MFTRHLEELEVALNEHAIVAITDLNGNITYVNDKFCVLSKYSRRELLGKNHRIINSGHHPKEFFQNLWETIKSGRTWKGDIRNVAKDGSIYWVATTIVPCLDEVDGKPYQFIAIRTEISQLKILEEEITQRKKLEQLNAAMLKEMEVINQELTNFAYIVSHDLKAPLRGINSLANWLAADYADQLGEDGAKKLNLIANRVQRMSGLVDGILAYSRAGRNSENKQTVDTNTLVCNIIELLAPPAHIAVEITSPLPPIYIVIAKAQQVFQNLLSNAIKFNDKPNGLVTINCIDEAPFWHFTIIDNGPGIEVKYFDKIFQLFQTLNRRDDVESTGVGCSIVKKIIELEGGKIWVESTFGEGTTFHFTLPHIKPDTTKSFISVRRHDKK